MTALEVGLLLLLLWAIATEIRLAFTRKRLEEITDSAIECGHIVTNIMKQLEDDGR